MILRSFIYSKGATHLKNIVLSTTFSQTISQKQPYLFFLSKSPSSSISTTTAFFSTITKQPKRYYYKLNGFNSINRTYHSEKKTLIIGNKNEKPGLLNNNKYLLSISGMSGSVILLFWYYYQHDINFRHNILALHRVSVAAMVGLKVAIQYQWMLLTCQYKQYDDEMKEKKKRECHLKSANLVLDGLQRLGGVYVKLGQHISAMAYVLPLEWTSTLSVLQDRCDPTSPNDIKALFLEDYGSNINDVFDYFDWKPLGVASLAQVHKAHLKDNSNHHHHNKNDDNKNNNGWVAIKIQHPRLDEFCQIDMNTVASIIGMIKWWFPDFGFEWVLQEMQESLPQELNFVNEANNARKVMNDFENDLSTALVIPKIIWVQRRILCMEYIKGARIDDLEYLKQHNIDPIQVSREITTIFSKMIFLHGFVHCDPHPGNILIRPKKNNSQNGKHNRYNFDLVLLDHGIYRTLTDELKNDYSNLWISLVKGDEKGIEYYAYKVGCKPPHHRLFASLLTGREWHTIEAANLSSTRSLTETNRVSGKTKLFLVKIADVLSALPRMMLALLKTSDLLRHLDETLRRSAPSSSSYRTYAIMVNYCAQAVWLDTKRKLLDAWSWSSCFSWCKAYINAWLSYHLIEFYTWFYQ